MVDQLQHLVRCMVPRHVRDVQDVFAGATLLLLEEFGQGLQEPAEEQLVVRSMEDDLLVAPIRAVGIQDVDAHGGLGALLVPTLRLEASAGCAQSAGFESGSSI